MTSRIPYTQLELTSMAGGVQKGNHEDGLCKLTQQTFNWLAMLPTQQIL